MFSPVFSFSLFSLRGTALHSMPPRFEQRRHLVFDFWSRRPRRHFAAIFAILSPSYFFAF